MVVIEVWRMLRGYAGVVEPGTPTETPVAEATVGEPQVALVPPRRGGKRRWIIAGSIAGAVLIAAGVGSGVWQWNEQAAAGRAYDEAVTAALAAIDERNASAVKADDARAHALELVTQSAGVVEAADPSLLAAAETRDQLIAAVETLSSEAELSTDDAGALVLPEATVLVAATDYGLARSAKNAVAGSTGSTGGSSDLEDAQQRPANREALREATRELQAVATQLSAESQAFESQQRDIAAGADAVARATTAVVASAHEHGAAIEVPELASQESRDRFATAVSALAAGVTVELSDDAAAGSATATDSGDEAASSVMLTAAALLTEYRDAHAALIASHEEGVRARDPANIEPTYIQGVLVVNKTYPLPSWYGNGLTAETLAAFGQMQAAAAEAGHSLTITSGFRSYATQASLYNGLAAQVGQAAADRDTARPGHSEHQSGLTFDLNCICEGFGHQADGQWVAANAHRFGFIVRYPQGKEHITGYIWEPWHLRYLGVDVATAVYESGLSLEEYLGITSRYAN